MNLRNAAGGLSSRFAHLAGLRRAAKPKGDETPATKDDVEDVAEDVEDLEEKVEELEEKVEEEEEEDEAEEAPDNPPEPERPAEARAFRNGRKAGAKAERARCAAIFGAKEAALNGPLAASLAFESDLPVKQALAILRAGTAGGGADAGAATGGLDRRMASTKRIQLGSEAGGPDRSTADGNAAFILGAGRGAADRQARK